MASWSRGDEASIQRGQSGQSVADEVDASLAWQCVLFSHCGVLMRKAVLEFHDSEQMPHPLV